MYISKVKNKGHSAVYRFSLNASLPAPWQIVSPGDGEVPSFQVSLGCCEVSCHRQGRGPQCRTGGHWPRKEGEAGPEDGAAVDRGGPRPAVSQVCGRDLHSVRAGLPSQPDLGSSPGSAIYNLSIFGQIS